MRNKYDLTKKKFRLATAEELPLLITRKEDLKLMKLCNIGRRFSAIAEEMGWNCNKVTTRVKLLKYRDSQIHTKSANELLDAIPYGVVAVE